MASEKDGVAIGERIRHLLANRPISWLAREADVSRSTLNAAIGGTLPSVDKAFRIARALGTTVEYLVTGEGAPSPGGRASGPQIMAEPGRQFQVQLQDRGDYQALGERLREAHLQLEEATQAVGVIPDEGLRQVLLTLIFRYRVPVEEVALLLTAKARRAEGGQ